MEALIDHDLVVFRCAASAEEDPFNIAVARAEELLDQLLEKQEQIAIVHSYLVRLTSVSLSIQSTKLIVLHLSLSI